MEINLADYLDAESIEIPENTVYELKSVIIHRGGTYGGHYHAYIQDEMSEGDWYLQMPEEFKKEPRPIEKVQYDPTRFMTEEQIKKMEEDKLNEANNTAALQIEVEQPEEKQNYSKGKKNKGNKN